MEPDLEQRPTRAHRPPLAALACGWLVLAAGLPAAAAAPTTAASAPAGIFTCTDDQGRRLTSDRPIPECTAREQRILNRDGSLKAIKPPTMTAEERADKETRERLAAEARIAQADAVRRDRNLMNRFPDEAAHDRSRTAALDTVRLAIRASSLRLEALGLDRKPLQDEAEFYKGKTLPIRLKGLLDANDAAFAAQRSAMQTQEAELVRINKLYDVERERLRLLWSGVQPGSLGPVAAGAARP
jgi:hypothetical protein